jgi:pimeloyl-ACP methyl ester carboxylesterase
MQESTIKVGGTRDLSYSEIGDPAWPCVFFFHGSPISRLHLAYLEDQLVAEKLRVVSPDRPAYGRSSPQPGRSMADWPVDVAALADALKIEQFVVAGHSSGGPYALVCAALLPQRVTAGVVLGGVTDMGWPGAWDGYLDVEIEIMRQPDESAAIAWCAERFGADGSGFLTDAPLEFPEPDNAFFADAKVGPALGAAVAEALRQGIAAYGQDVFIQGRPWPFDPSAIGVPVHVVHGELDTLVPVSHSRHTADLIPTSTLHLLPGHGHMTIVSELPGIVSDML